MEYIKKYKMKNGTFISMLILAIICFITCILCSYCLNIDEEGLKQLTNININVAIVKTIKDTLVIILSIVGTNLLLSLLIDIDSKNQIITDVIQNDVISSPEFYKLMDDDNKKKMLDALEQHLYFKHNLTQSMFDSIRKKIINMACDYYYESCDYIISCNVYDTYIEKEITRKVSLKSFNDNYEIHNFSVGNCSSKEIEGVDAYILVSLEIDGRKIDIKKDVVEINTEIGNLDEQNEYNIKNTYIYNKPLNIYKDKETIVTVKCKTRTAIDDKSSTFRVVKPCKNFSLNYSIKQHEKYRLAVDAFGFLDNADSSANNTSYSDVNITFRDWIFKYDGVVIIILDK